MGQDVMREARERVKMIHRAGVRRAAVIVALLAVFFAGLVVIVTGRVLLSLLPVGIMGGCFGVGVFFSKRHLVRALQALDERKNDP